MLFPQRTLRRSFRPPLKRKTPVMLSVHPFPQVMCFLFLLVPHIPKLDNHPHDFRSLHAERGRNTFNKGQRYEMVGL
jgi:hypothetical protein